jgi:hypothetical protein
MEKVERVRVCEEGGGEAAATSNHIEHPDTNHANGVMDMQKASGQDNGKARNPPPPTLPQLSHPYPSQTLSCT